MEPGNLRNLETTWEKTSAVRASSWKCIGSGRWNQNLMRPYSSFYRIKVYPKRKVKQRTRQKRKENAIIMAYMSAMRKEYRELRPKEKHK